MTAPIQLPELQGTPRCGKMTYYIVPAWSDQAGQCRIVAREMPTRSRRTRPGDASLRSNRFYCIGAWLPPRPPATEAAAQVRRRIPAESPGEPDAA